MVFLANTWLDEARLIGIHDSLWFGYHHGVSKITHGCGLALFWKKDFNLHIESSSINHIDALINKGQENVWRFIGFYGAPETHLQMESWNLLKDLRGCFDLPWLCVGNFNELLKTHEKFWGCLRPYGQMQNFLEALDECGLLDLGFVGNKFTWYKNYLDGVMCRHRILYTLRLWLPFSNDVEF